MRLVYAGLLRMLYHSKALHDILAKAAKEREEREDDVN
jgi:hypothetical protein